MNHSLMSIHIVDMVETNLTEFPMRNNCKDNLDFYSVFLV